MVFKWSVVLLCALGLASSQDGYSRDNPAYQLGYDSFNQAYTNNGDGDEIHGDEIPGEAGRDYPIYSEVPQTGFNCQNQQSPGYYADPETQCQAFYICQKGGKSDGFLCPNGTVFNQQYLVCDWWYNFDCSQAEELYSVNEQIVQAMQEADARLSQQQDGYNYNAPGGNQNGADHSGRYTGPQPAGLQDPSTVYGVPSGNGNGRNIGNGNGNGNGRHNVNGNGRPNDKISSPRPVYGVPSSGSGSSRPASQLNSGNGNGPSSRYNTENNNAFNGNHNGNEKLEDFNGNDSPKPVYGVPSLGNGVSGPASQLNLGSGNGNNLNGNHRGEESFGNNPSSQYNSRNNGFNGNDSPMPVYGVPSSGNGAGGLASQLNSRNGFENHRGQEFFGNGPSSRYVAGNNGFSGNDSPKPVYGVPSSGNGASGSASQFNSGNGNGNHRGQEAFGNSASSRYAAGNNSPKPVYGVPSSGNGGSGISSQFNSGNGNGNNFNGNHRGQESFGNGPSSRYTAGNSNGLNTNNSPKPVYGVPSLGNSMSGPTSQYNSVGYHSTGYNGNQNSKLEDLSSNVGAPKPVYGVPSSNVGSGSRKGIHSNGFNGNGNKNSRLEDFSENVDSPKPVYGVPSLGIGNSGPGFGFNGNGNKNSKLEDLNGDIDSPNPAYGVPSSGNGNNGGNGNGYNSDNGRSEFADAFNGNENSGFDGSSGNVDRSYLPPSGDSQDYTGSSHKPSDGDNYSAGLNGNNPDRSYLPSQ